MAALQTPWYDKAVEALKLNGKGKREKTGAVLPPLPRHADFPLCRRSKNLRCLDEPKTAALR